MFCGEWSRAGRKANPAGDFRRVLAVLKFRGGNYGGEFFFSIARPMLMRLSAITPRPTQRFIPASPLYRQRLSPCRRLTTLMRPSHPVRHFWPLRNQRFFCSRLRSGLLVERLGMQTRLTPIACAAASFLAE